jgi:NAD(P)-dependent dehydrogenase (short-subunit alcohol dehydrogenase family)
MAGAMTDLFDLHGKTAVVTGSSRGIGRAIALALATHGAQVVISSRNLAVEYGAHNVRVNCIAPGLVRTDFARALWENAENLTTALKGTPLNRIGEPDDIAGVAVFLASHAARYITGQTLVVDGGATVTVGGI